MVAALKWKDNRQPISLDSRARELIKAAQDGDCDTISALVSGGLNVDCETISGTTALMKAASCGQADTVRLLLDLGSAVNKARPDGFTPLILATFFGHDKIVRELLTHGADVKAKSRGISASTWANARGFMSIALLLEATEKSPVSLNAQSRVEPAVIQSDTPPVPPISQVTFADNKEDAGSNQPIEQAVAKPSALPSTAVPSSAVPSTALPSTSWSVHDSGEGIRRIGGPAVQQVGIGDAWDRPIEGVPPFSPYSALLARLSTKRNLAVACITTLVVGAALAGAVWRIGRVPNALVKIPANTAPSRLAPVEPPVVTEPSRPAEPSAPSSANPAVVKNAESVKPEQTSAETTPPPVSVITRDAEPRILKNIAKTPSSRRIHHRTGATTGDAGRNEATEESSQPAAVTFVSKPPATSSRPKVTNDLPAQPIAPLAGSTIKKRVIQWP